MAPKLAALTGARKTVVVSPMPKTQKEIAPVEPIVMTTTTEQIPKTTKREKKLERPKKIERKSLCKPPPLPTALPQKLPATNDRFHDPIPRPAPFPSARPPRSHVPALRRQAPAEDHQSTAGANGNAPSSPALGVKPEREDDKVSDVVQQD